MCFMVQMETKHHHQWYKFVYNKAIEWQLLSYDKKSYTSCVNTPKILLLHMLPQTSQDYQLMSLTKPSFSSVTTIS